jgi:hypothetical protein
MPASEAFQLATGLAIPLLLIPHAAGIRLGYSIQGMEFGYARLLYQFWVVSPDFALPRQILLLVTIWIHGCIGLRSWLRTMRWYSGAVPALASLATLVPVLAMLGLIDAGLNIREAAQHDELNVTVVATHGETVDRIVLAILSLYVGGVAIARKWWRIDPRLATVSDVGRLALTFLTCAIPTAVIGMLTLLGDGLISHSDAIKTAVNWWQSDSIAIISFAPLLLIYGSPRLTHWMRERTTTRYSADRTIHRTFANWMMIGLQGGSVLFALWLRCHGGSLWAEAEVRGALRHI